MGQWLIEYQSILLMLIVQILQVAVLRSETALRSRIDHQQHFAFIIRQGYVAPVLCLYRKIINIHPVPPFFSDHLYSAAASGTGQRSLTQPSHVALHCGSQSYCTQPLCVCQVFFSLFSPCLTC